MSKERDILKSLLLKEELELLDQLQQKILSKEQFTKEVSDVLAGAISKAERQDESLERALAKPIKQGVKQAFSDSKQSIIDALLPLMGQLIRKTVANSIKQFVTDINRTLELGFSAKALKWRWQALRSDSSFAEIVFQKTIRYQVSELFLINRENGLLIEQVGAEDIAKNKDAVSAMLTAIRDFIGDSLLSPNSDLLSADFGDNVIIISSGPHAYLASIIKGSPTERLKAKSQQLIEDLHADFSEQILQEKQYQQSEELQNHLRGYLITKSISGATKTPKLLPWILATILIVAGLSYWSYTRNKQYNNLVNQANTISGFYLQSVKRTSSGFEVKGLVDPLADISTLQKDEIELKTRPFVSLDSEMIKQRVLSVTAPYKSISFSLKNKTLLLSGSVTKPQHDDLFKRLQNIMGILSIKDNLIIDNQKEIRLYLQSQDLDKDKDYLLTSKSLQLVGEMSYKQHQLFISNFNRLFPKTVIVEKKLNIIDSTVSLFKQINQTTLNLLNFKLSDSGKSKLNEVIKSLHSLNARGVKMELEIIGTSDCVGKSSDINSQLRANSINSILVEQGVSKELLLTSITSCDVFNSNPDNSLLGVSFNIKNKQNR